MKKVLIVLVIAAAAGVAVFYFMSSAFKKDEMRDYLNELVAIRRPAGADMVKRPPYSSYFLDQGYDESAPYPEEWIARWNEENGDPSFVRKVVSVELPKSEGDDMVVDFVLEDGLKASADGSIPAELKQLRYQAVLVRTEGPIPFKVKALRCLDGPQQ